MVAVGKGPVQRTGHKAAQRGFSGPGHADQGDAAFLGQVGQAEGFGLFGNPDIAHIFSAYVLNAFFVFPGRKSDNGTNSRHIF